MLGVSARIVIVIRRCVVRFNADLFLRIIRKRDLGLLGVFLFMNVIKGVSVGSSVRIASFSRGGNLRCVCFVRLTDGVGVLRRYRRLRRVFLWWNM